MTQNSPTNSSLERDLLKFLHMYGIYWVVPGDSSGLEGSEYVWQRGCRVSKAHLWPAEVDPYLGCVGNNLSVTIFRVEPSN